MTEQNRRRNFLALTAAVPAAAVLPATAMAADAATASSRGRDDDREWDLVRRPGSGTEDVSVDYDGRVWIIADSPTTYKNGALLYSDDEGKTFKDIPAATSDLARVSGGNNGIVWTVASEAYGSLWKYKFGDTALVLVNESNSYYYPTGARWVDVAVGYDNTVYAVSSDGKLYKITEYYGKFKFELVRFRYRGYTPYFYRVAVGLNKTIYLVDKYGVLYKLKRDKLERVVLYFKVIDVAATYKDIWVCSDRGEVWTNANDRRGRFEKIDSPRHYRSFFECIAVGLEDDTVWTVGKDESLWKYGEDDDHGHGGHDDDDHGHDDDDHGHGGYKK